ncbi:hypothetical protein LEP1GSC043_0114 [Leptospira weilii str. Ecochallenge]|uniref:Uncharacterized protein n=1 Tax=Leptospira weilii str. Ecochallenge TaxID=1049986 RepID=N1U324_9LEPT|nr:hypothetical protein LEP1GSC043_0114 [Leptospira weilii str. Ecochallenge]
MKSYSGKTIRTIGIERAKFQIGLINLVLILDVLLSFNPDIEFFSRYCSSIRKLILLF